MKWNNRAIVNETFVSEWQAQEQAAILQHEVSQFCNLPLTWTRSTSSRSIERSDLVLSRSRPKRPTSLHVSFADDLELWIGIEDSLEMYKLQVPLEIGATGQTPWSCPSFEPTEGSTRDQRFAAHTDGAGQTHFYHLPSSPLWMNGIMDLLNQEGHYDPGEEEEIVFVTSYYINHQHHRFHDEPRVLRFDREVAEWERDVRFIWEDLIDHDAQIDIVIVRPDPPKFAFPATAATVIVHQHASPERAACLISQVHIMDPETRFSESAHSTELQITRDQAIHLAGSEAVCQQRAAQGAGDCTIHIGHQMLPADANIAIFHGLGLHIRIPSTLTQEEIEQNLVRRLHRQRQLRDGNEWDPPEPDIDPENEHPPQRTDPGQGDHHAPEDATSFMARNAATFLQSSRTSSSSTSVSAISTSSFHSEDLRRAVIFTIDGRAFPVSLPWSDTSEHEAIIAREGGFDSGLILQLYQMHQRPRDLERLQLECFLLQNVHEPRPAQFMRLILVDIDIYDQQHFQPFAMRRLAKWLPTTVNRRSVFRLMGLDQQFQEQEELCFLWHNHVAIEADQVPPLRLEDGDYVQIRIGEQPESLSCISDSTLQRLNITNESWQPTPDPEDEHLDLFQRSIQQLQQTWQQLEAQLPQQEIKVAPQHERGAMLPRDQDQGRNQEGRTMPQPIFHADDYQSFHNLFSAQALIECEEEGPIAYVETWYLHHHRWNVCRISRAVRLHHDSPDWIDDIIEPWRDVFDATDGATIHLVRPKPPCMMTECVMAHLIIEQSSTPDHTIGLLSFSRSTRRGPDIRHVAHSMPQLMNQAQVLRLGEVFDQCGPRYGQHDCRVRCGEIPFGLFDWDEVPRATNLVIYMHYRRDVTAADNDDIELMQQSSTRWSRTQSPPQAGLELPRQGGQCEGFTFNPNAASFVPNAPVIRNAPEHIQDLYQQWMRTAFSWAGEQASTTVMTWFVDQFHPGHQVCLHPRPTRLYEDFRQWTDQLRRTWSDRALPGAPIMIHVVDPSPPQVHPEIATHVLLVQNPQDTLSSIVVTGFDSSLPHHRPFTQLAATFHEHFLLDHLMMLIGLGGRCLFPDSPMHCQARYRQEPIYPGAPFPTRDGYGLVFHLIPRLQQQGTQGVGLNMLQTRTCLQRQSKTIHLQELISEPIDEDCERQTTASVAHEQWPQDLDIFPAVGECRPQDWVQPDSKMLVKVIYAQEPSPPTAPPSTVELQSIYSAEDAEQELRAWGFHYKVFLCGEHDTIFALSLHEKLDDFVYVYCATDSNIDQPVIIQRQHTELTETQHMRFLYAHGFIKAVILQHERWHERVHCVHFTDVKPEHAPALGTPRARTPWPAPQPRIHTIGPMIDFESVQNTLKGTCQIGIDLQELRCFFEDCGDILWKDYELFDLPDFVGNALQHCGPIDRVDRYVIFADGSSHSQHRHKPPLWVAEHDISDSWAFAVFAEQYAENSHDPPQLEFLGWHCQQVLYDLQAPHSIGTSKIGSDAAETEALFWAGMWRLSRNNNVPTVFVTDSRLTGDQAAGRCGSSTRDAPFLNLRSVFQALHGGLPHGHLAVQHVRSHTGDPLNELVDWLAKREAHTSQLLPRQTVNMQSFCHILRHLWIVTDQAQDLPCLSPAGLEVAPIDLPVHQGLSSNQVKSEMSNVTFNLSCGTANVRTFYRGEQGHPGKLHYVREQFQAHGIHFLGLQETRTDEGSSCNGQVYRIASGSDHGQLGVEVWVNLKQPFTHGDSTQCFKRSDFVAVSRSPRHLLVHVLNDHIDIWLLCAHAPHSGAPQEIREHWWQQLSQLVCTYVTNEHVLVMIDANARTGPLDNEHVFDLDDCENINTPLLRDFLHAHGLCVPATLPLHQGTRTTWTHPADGTEHRIDFVFMPCSWTSWCTQSCSLDNLDFGHLGDHRAMAIEIQWKGTTQLPHRSGNRTKFDRNKIKTAQLAMNLDGYQPPPWTTNIEEQVRHLNHFIQETLHSQCPKPRSGPKKSYISDEIWNIRAIKLRHHRQLKNIQKQSRTELLSRTFLQWAHRLSRDRHEQSEGYHHTLLIHGLKTGIALHQTARQLRSALSMSKRQEVKEAIHNLPEDSAASTILNTLKPIIGPTNPKLRRVSPLPMVLNDCGEPCTTPDELCQRWADFFGAMEGGERVSEQDLRADWIAHLNDFMQETIQLGPEDVPSLTDLEFAFRRVRCGKAVGDDDVPPELCHSFPTEMARATYTQLLKLCVHGQEALQHKGGMLIAAWKRKGPQDQCSSYRSLLISLHIGKTVHRAVRDHQADLYEAFLRREQVGGRRHFPVSMGVHYIRAAARAAKNVKRSHSLIFLDLQEAFYRVLRPVAIGGKLTDALLAQVAMRLQLPEDALRDLQFILQLPSATELAGLPRHLQRALRALHTNTHFRVRGQPDVTHTRIGTRPGDPFADVIFGYMFSRLLAVVEEKMENLGLLETFEDVDVHGMFPQETDAPLIHHTMLGPTWMDDLCISITADTACALETKAGLATGVLLETCMNHGVTPNLQKGKSEILLTFRGQGSRALKQKYFGPQQGQRLHVVSEYGMHAISVVGEYIHLGNMAHHSGTTRREMRRRIAIGNGAFNLHRRLLFQNKDLTAQKRAELFMSLVHSKISYGTESWVLDDAKSRQYFNGAILRLYKRLLKLPPDSLVQHEEVTSQAQLPAPEDLLRVTRLRYLGLLYKCEQVTPWAILRADTAWTTLLRADLQWLWQLIRGTTSLRDPATHFQEWEYLLRYHRSYWKTLLQRGMHLVQLHRQDQLLLRRLHHDIFAHLAHWGPLSHAPVRPHIPVERQYGHYGCMKCQLRCRSKAGEGAHLFKVHGVVAKERRWMTHTACSICLKEYHSFDKLQGHLRYSESCRRQLSARPPCGDLQPGIGSRDNNALRAHHDDLLPVQQAEGPRALPRPPGEVDLHHVALYEQLVLMIFDFQTNDSHALRTATVECIASHEIGWTQTQLTLNKIKDELINAPLYDAIVPRDTVCAVLSELADPINWKFLTEITYETANEDHLYHLDLYEQWCQDLASSPTPWRPTLQCPRPRFWERVVLHAYSGRRRPGDFQWYLDDLGKQGKLDGLFVVSLDIVIDSTWGDISNPTTQKFWLHALRSGHVIGFLCGPPCCTWSTARGKQLQQPKKRGPRVIRDRSDLWGFHSVSLREKRQLMDGHLLLGFSLHAMILLSTVQGSGALEHPAEPNDEQAASIWRLPLMQFILSLPGFSHIEFAQGLLGADSTKRTGLLTLNLPDLPRYLRANAVCAHLPRAQTIGTDEHGQFRTAKLKEYPPALCKALAEGFFSILVPYNATEQTSHVPDDFLTRCAQMVCTNMGSHIGADYAGR